MGNGKKRRNAKSQTALGTANSWAPSLVRSAIVTISAVAAMYATGTLPTHPQLPVPSSSVGSSSTIPEPERKREISFEEAKQSPSLREAFVDQFVARMNVPPYVRSIRYDAGQESQKKEGDGVDTFFNMSVNEDVPLQRVSRLESTIKVLDKAFSLPSEEEFRAGLEYHELTHARDCWEGFGFIPNAAFFVDHGGKKTVDYFFHKTVLELHAVEEQYKRSREDGRIYSRTYLRHLLAFWMDNYRRLWLVNPSRGDTTALRIRFFHDMMGNYPQRLNWDPPFSPGRYCITLAPDVNEKSYSVDEWRLAQRPIVLPAELNPRIDRFFKEYVKGRGRPFQYQSPEFDAFVARTIPDQPNGGR